MEKGGTKKRMKEIKCFEATESLISFLLATYLHKMPWNWLKNCSLPATFYCSLYFAVHLLMTFTNFHSLWSTFWFCDITFLFFTTYYRELVVTHNTDCPSNIFFKHCASADFVSGSFAIPCSFLLSHIQVTCLLSSLFQPISICTWESINTLPIFSHPILEQVPWRDLLWCLSLPSYFFNYNSCSIHKLYSLIWNLDVLVGLRLNVLKSWYLSYHRSKV